MSAPRVTSQFWVSAYLRAVERGGGHATLRRRGAAGAGAIAIVISRADRLESLFMPAPQADFDEARPADRRFVPLFDGAFVEPLAVHERLAREIRFDPDLWIIDVEDRDGRSFL